MGDIGEFALKHRLFLRTYRWRRIDAALLIPVRPLCNQAVGLVGAELERQGIASVAIQLLRELAEKARPPRALLVPFRHGHPLDRPGDPERQHAMIEAALQMLEDPTLETPALVKFDPAWRGSGS